MTGQVVRISNSRSGKSLRRGAKLLEYGVLVTLAIVACPRSVSAFCGNYIEPAPIATHWNAPLGTYQFGAGGQHPVFAAGAVSTYPYTWGPGYLPDYGAYSQFPSNFSATAVAAGSPCDTKSSIGPTAYAVLNYLTEDLGGHTYSLLNPTGNLVQKIQSAPAGSVKIIHGLDGGAGFYTLILPPNWNPNWAQGSYRYPVVFQGYYDVATNLFSGMGQAQQIASWIGDSAASGRSGAIGVIWNGGASVAGPFLRQDQFSVLINALAAFAGADKQRIIALGESRGGTIALMLAGHQAQDAPGSSCTAQSDYCIRF